jgi:RimJ/RimL family protein N-acetyltransferase
MSVIFYGYDAGNPISGRALPPGIEAAFWQPHRNGFPQGLFSGATNRAWWAVDKLHLFARHDFTVIALHRQGRLLHRLLVSPKWYRFPDMDAADLQIGMLWTDPEARGQGLAKCAVTAAHRKFAGRFRRMWYLVDEDNLPSRRLIESIGYHKVGQGERTARFGLRALGQFKMTAPDAAERPVPTLRRASLGRHRSTE